jgi:hypothetical protein
MVDKKVPEPRPGVPSPVAADPTAPGPKSKSRTEDVIVPTSPASPSDSTIEAATRAKKRTANVKDHIGRQLRALYDEVASQPVPDRFMELLNRLDVKRGEE